MPDGLTPKQEAFALAYMETGNGGEAYRRAYDVDPNAKDSWIYVEAWQLLNNPKVAQRVEELQKQAEELAFYTLKQASKDLERIMQGAEAEKQFGAAVSAANSRAKLFGIDAPKRVQISGPNGGPIKTEEAGPRDKLADAIARLSSRSGEGSAPSEPE